MLPTTILDMDFVSLCTYSLGFGEGAIIYRYDLTMAVRFGLSRFFTKVRCALKNFSGTQRRAKLPAALACQAPSD
jgi:hypothetical protein